MCHRHDRLLRFSIMPTAFIYILIFFSTYLLSQTGLIKLTPPKGVIIDLYGKDNNSKAALKR